MTTFQALVFAMVQGFAEFLPIGPAAHHLLVADLFGWPVPADAFAGALTLGSLLAVLIFFRHDWASIISSFLQVILLRKKPMTLDERMPFFLMASSLPTAATWYYFQGRIPAALMEPFWVAVILAAFSVPLWLTDSMSRRNKGMFDWNWLDALLVGLGQALLFVPGIGRMAGALAVGSLRNFNREAMTKFAFFASAPILAGSAYFRLKDLDFRAPMPMDGLSWFSFALTIIVTMLAGLLAIGGFTKHVQRKALGGYLAYRMIVAIGVGGAIWAKAHGYL